MNPHSLSFKIFVLVLHFTLGATYAKELPPDSIFWLESEWSTHEGKKIKLKELEKTPTIVSMVFLRCRYSCPITLRDMKNFESKIQEIPEGKRKDYRLVLISIDPEHDSPEEMREYLKTNKLDPAHWLIMTSSPENIRELAATLGFSYRKDKAMEFAHSMLTWIFDQNGVKRLEIKGQDQTPATVVKAMKELW